MTTQPLTKRPHPGRKLAPTDNPANPVVALIEQALLKIEGNRLKSLSPFIGLSYNNLWGVYREMRNMPVIPLSKLCHLLGMTDGDALRLYQLQPVEPRNKPDRTPKPPPDPELGPDDVTFGE